MTSIITFKRTETDDEGFIVTVKDRELFLGQGLAKYNNLKWYLDEINVEEEGLKVPLARAVLNSLDLQGIKTVYCENKGLFPLASSIGFKKESDVMVLNLESFFECKHN